ncbi:MAG: Zn-ribbon domain-containing OB-fold protein [Candidatus Thermoplasmatota archaeon]|nr:Zn-ribbon domain-containing OB-fold protein [Candidatus Thermoplasmatota archaeon]MDD5778676.1 Zn-ribbon domain-containing OB-fold protein [Candidatus Thermoplasmatota archaeon]
MAVPRYWREIPQRYNLVGTKCGSCGKIYFPPKVVCPTCRRKSLGHMEDCALAGRGTVESYTVIYAPPPHFEGEEPYTMALIKMDEGCYLMGQVVDLEPQEIHIGLRVEACFRRIYEDGTRGAIQYGYKFKKMEEAETP